MPYADEFVAVTELTGKKCVLRPVNEDMTLPLLEAIEESRADLYEFLPWSSESIEDVTGFIRSARNQQQTGAGLHLAVFDKTSDRLVGVMGFSHISAYSPKGEVGYWIRSGDTGKGFATDALRTFVRFCRNELGFVRIDARVATGNLASQAVLRSCGFQQEGLKRKAMLCHGRWLDLILMGKLLDVPPA